jgi:hypothetical protein
MSHFSTIASVHVGKGGEHVEAACRRLWITKRDEGFAEMASRMREARDGQSWVNRISERGSREHTP